MPTHSCVVAVVVVIVVTAFVLRHAEELILVLADIDLSKRFLARIC